MNFNTNLTFYFKLKHISRRNEGKELHMMPVAVVRNFVEGWGGGGASKTSLSYDALHVINLFHLYGYGHVTPKIMIFVKWRNVIVQI